MNTGHERRNPPSPSSPHCEPVTQHPTRKVHDPVDLPPPSAKKVDAHHAAGVAVYWYRIAGSLPIIDVCPAPIVSGTSRSALGLSVGSPEYSDQRPDVSVYAAILVGDDRCGRR